MHCSWVVVTFTALLVGVSCATSLKRQADDQQPQEDSSDNATSTMADVYTSVGLKLLSKTTADPNSGNVVLSPLGVFASLFLALEESGQPNWSNVMNVLDIEDANSTEVMEALQRYYEDVQNGSSDVFNMTLFNAWLSDEGISLDSSAQDELQQFFDSEASQQFSLIKDDENAAMDWPNGQLPFNFTAILDYEDFFSSKTSLLTLTTAYFELAWEDILATTSNVDVEFTDLLDQKNWVSMMEGMGNVSVKDVDNLMAQVMEVPYKLGGIFSTFIFLPHDSNGVQELVDTLADPTVGGLFEILNEVLDNMPEPSPQMIQVPQISAKTAVSLTSGLETLGLDDVDFSWLDGVDPGAVDLTLDNFQNLAVIEVSENDLETMDLSDLVDFDSLNLSSVSEVATFIANRPFMFVVRDNANKVLLLAGVMAFPGDSEN